MESLRVGQNNGHEISVPFCFDIVLLTERLSNPLSWLQAEMLGNVFLFIFFKKKNKLRKKYLSSSYGSN